MVYFGLDAEEYDRQFSNRELLGRMAKYMIPYRRRMVVAVIFVTLGSLANGLVPFLASRVLAQAEGGSPAPADFLLLVGLVLGLNLAGYLFNYVKQRNYVRVISHVVYDLRDAVTRNVLKQDLAFFDKYSTGKIVSRINSDSQSFGEMANLVMEALSSVFVMIFVLIPMFAIELRLTLLFLVMVPAVFVFTTLFRKRARAKTLLGQRALASVNAFVQETMAGIQVAKTFRQERKLHADFERTNQDSYRVNLSRALFLNVIFPALQVIQAVMLAALLYAGGGQVLQGTIGAADLYLFIQSLWLLFFPIFTVASFWPQFQTGMAAAERIFALIDSEPRVVQRDDKIIEPLRGALEIRDLSFHYDDGTQVFEHFDLAIAPGESVAIVGHTGAGKSSLANLLLRFYEFQGGKVIVDGTDIRELDLHAYRQQVRVIPQSPFLWADTLEYNVKYGAPAATRADVRAALEHAGGADWVDDLDEGLQTDVGERGRLLSMGQRQLVVFARMLLLDPRVLILDEATASVDPFTETRIQEALEELMAQRTTVVIAHRLWTVRHVDRIVVLDHGRIVEEGSHDELVARGGHYADLYNTYFKHQSYDFLERRDPEDPARVS